MNILKFAGIPDYINVSMSDSEYSKFTDSILSLNQLRDLALAEIADWIRIHLPTCYGFLKWYGETDTRGWFYPKDKMVTDTSTMYGYFKVVIGGLVMKPTINYHNILYEYDGHILNPSEARYCIDDFLVTSEVLNYCRGICLMNVHIKDVIFNDPATIVFWSDGTKTVCTCSEADTYDPEKGLALCCMKKLLYKNKGHIFNDAREKWLKKAKKNKK